MSTVGLDEDFFKQGAIFTLEETAHIFWGDVQRYAERPQQPALYAPDFFLETLRPWFAFENHLALPRKSLQESLPSSSILVLDSLWPESSKASDANFDRQFHWVKKSIEKNQLQKAVPFRHFPFSLEAPIHQLVPHCLRTALSAGAPHIYGLWSPEEFILGATPEVLFEQTKENSVETMALAGTTLWESYLSKPKEFMEDPKEIREHEIVVQFLREQLSPLGKLICGQRSVIQAGQLAHFKTPVILELHHATSFAQLIEALHPTPALGCYPRKNWKVLLQEMSGGQKRKRFGAPFALSLSSQKACAAVAIRNIEKVNGRYLMPIGCGVVQDSFLENENREIQQKQKSTARILGL